MSPTMERLTLGEWTLRVFVALLLSLGLLVRTTTKKKDGDKERLKREIFVCEVRI